MISAELSAEKPRWTYARVYAATVSLVVVATEVELAVAAGASTVQHVVSAVRYAVLAVVVAVHCNAVAAHCEVVAAHCDVAVVEKSVVALP